MNYTRYTAIRKRIKDGSLVTTSDVAHLALNEVEYAKTVAASDMRMADFHLKTAEVYARIAQAMKK